MDVQEGIQGLSINTDTRKVIMCCFSQHERTFIGISLITFLRLMDLVEVLTGC